MRTVRTPGTAVLAAALEPTACATQDQKNNTDSSGHAPMNVAVVYSRTGLLSAYGAQYVAGLKAGLDYATKGTGKVGNHRIEITYADDGGQPARAVSAMKQYAGQGYKIAAGTYDSGRATQCATVLAADKVPARVHFVGELPYSVVGKVVRRRLCELSAPTATDA